jgi:translation initiation factor eIF-2B subunit alpha/methylthioribose-1-phosphate isomerase
MRINIAGETKDIKTIWRKDNLIYLIDQRKLPHFFEITTLQNHRETATAIKDMVLRGAGAIGVAGAYGMAQAALEAKDYSITNFKRYIEDSAERLRSTRPTAANLFSAIDRCLQIGSHSSVNEWVKAIISEADSIAKDDLEASRRIGEYGSSLIENGYRVLTHCNAGALAFIDYGTALSPIRFSHRKGKKVFVYVDETRPRCQGSRLTAWELEQEGIPYAIIVDNAAGYFMRRRDVDIVIVGADRIAANGDVANKIGTYEKAVVAKENDIPFYVAAPKMTFDINCKNGDEIEIEERGLDEVLGMWGVNEKGEQIRVNVAQKGSKARNPAFDITPAEYVTAFITEEGIFKPPFHKQIQKFIQTK